MVIDNTGVLSIQTVLQTMQLDGVTTAVDKEEKQLKDRAQVPIKQWPWREGEMMHAEKNGL